MDEEVRSCEIHQFPTLQIKRFPSFEITRESTMQSDESDYIKVLRIKGANGEERTLQFPMKLDLERPKRPRTTFSEEQLRLLEEAFQQNGYLTGEARMALASRLALSDTQSNRIDVPTCKRSSSKLRDPKPVTVSKLCLSSALYHIDSILPILDDDTFPDPVSTGL
ncbi:homeobox domain protein, partial [Teladorsagia circumcincta]